MQSPRKRTRLALLLLVGFVALVVVFGRRSARLALPPTDEATAAGTLQLRRLPNAAPTGVDIPASSRPISMDAAPLPPIHPHPSPRPTPDGPALLRPASTDHLERRERAPGKPVATRYHRIVEGDTLEELAAYYLQDRRRAMEIFAANRELLTQPDVLPLGMRLTIPPLVPGGGDRPMVPVR